MGTLFDENSQYQRMKAIAGKIQDENESLFQQFFRLQARKVENSPKGALGDTDVLVVNSLKPEKATTRMQEYHNATVSIDRDRGAVTVTADDLPPNAECIVFVMYGQFFVQASEYLMDVDGDMVREDLAKSLFADKGTYDFHRVRIQFSMPRIDGIRTDDFGRLNVSKEILAADAKSFDWDSDILVIVYYDGSADVSGKQA